MNKSAALVMSVFFLIIGFIVFPLTARAWIIAEYDPQNATVIEGCDLTVTGTFIDPGSPPGTQPPVSPHPIANANVTFTISNQTPVNIAYPLNVTARTDSAGQASATFHTNETNGNGGYFIINGEVPVQVAGFTVNAPHNVAVGQAVPLTARLVTPAGPVDGVNMVFALTHESSAGLIPASEHLFSTTTVNGIAAYVVHPTREGNFTFTATAVVAPPQCQPTREVSVEVTQCGLRISDIPEIDYGKITLASTNIDVLASLFNKYATTTEKIRKISWKIAKSKNSKEELELEKILKESYSMELKNIANQIKQFQIQIMNWDPNFDEDLHTAKPVTFTIYGPPLERVTIFTKQTMTAYNQRYGRTLGTFEINSLKVPRVIDVQIPATGQLFVTFNPSGNYGEIQIWVELNNINFSACGLAGSTIKITGQTRESATQALNQQSRIMIGEIRELERKKTFIDIITGLIKWVLAKLKELLDLLIEIFDIFDRVSQTQISDALEAHSTWLINNRTLIEYFLPSVKNLP